MGIRIDCPIGCAFFLIALLIMPVSGHSVYQIKAEYLSYSMVPFI